MSDSNDDTNFLIPFSNVTGTNSSIKLNSDAGVLTYNPRSGTLTSGKFDGDGSGLTSIIASAVTSEATNTISIGTQNAAAPKWLNSVEI